MLDIIILYFITKQMGTIAITKGEPPMRWKIRSIVAWFLAQLIGFSVGFAILGQDKLLMIFVIGLGFAVGGYHITLNQLQAKPDQFNPDI